MKNKIQHNPCGLCFFCALFLHMSQKSSTFAGSFACKGKRKIKTNTIKDETIIFYLSIGYDDRECVGGGF